MIEPIAIYGSVFRRLPATAKAAFDRLAAAIGLVVLAPFLLMVAAVIVLGDHQAAFFWQSRVGRFGRPFQLLKFRSMYVGLPGTLITARDDMRVTRIGEVLRKYKIDELPQLWNVLKGEMSLVGPRPEIPAFVDRSNPVWRLILEVKPGITDLASLMYRQEEEILASARDSERYYRESVLPAKLELNLRYLGKRSFWLDFKLVLLTIRFSFFPAGFDSGRIQQIFLGKENA